MKNWDRLWTSINGSAGLRRDQGGKGGSRCASDAVVRRRAPKRETEYQFVRKCSAKYQARVWCALPVGSVNLGLYDEERAAWDAVRVWLRAGADPCKALPKGILPKWVVYGKKPIVGVGLAGEVVEAGVSRRNAGRKVDTSSPVGFYAVRKDVVIGPFADAAEAFKAMEQWLKALGLKMRLAEFAEPS